MRAPQPINHQMSSATNAKNAATIGDSVNDAGMFEFFPLAVGVANVREALDQLPKAPAYVTAGEGGTGFAELVGLLLAARDK